MAQQALFSSKYSLKPLLKYSLFLAPVFLLLSCSAPYSVTARAVPAAPELRQRALDYASEYMNNGATYEWGGQDPLPGRLVVDCSGLVIRCYQYACEDYGYTLPFADTTSKGLRQYSLNLGQQDLSPGDLLFMGEEGLINHVALFIQFDETDLVFIDATLKEEENINGVSVRRYRREDSRFISYGRMLVREIP